MTDDPGQFDFSAGINRVRITRWGSAAFRLHRARLHRTADSGLTPLKQSPCQTRQTGQYHRLAWPGFAACRASGGLGLRFILSVRTGFYKVVKSRSDISKADGDGALGFRNALAGFGESQLSVNPLPTVCEKCGQPSIWRSLVKRSTKSGVYWYKTWRHRNPAFEDRDRRKAKPPRYIEHLVRA